MWPYCEHDKGPTHWQALSVISTYPSLSESLQNSVCESSKRFKLKSAASVLLTSLNETVKVIICHVFNKSHC